jgi:SNF family Na+-dependent transporter
MAYAPVDAHAPVREQWRSRAGAVLALSGSAIGLGNLLRFPVVVVLGGGGTFLVPYFIALAVLAVPLMWAESAMGRLGGAAGKGSGPGLLPLLWPGRAAAYLGVLGVVLPLAVAAYYIYVESWALAFAVQSAAGAFANATTAADMSGALAALQGADADGVSGAGYAAFLGAVVANGVVLHGGVARGIERLARVAMPLLLVLALVLLVRVATLGTPDPVHHPDRSVAAGFAFLWRPDPARLTDAGVWLAAAGQVFFSTSVGFGTVSVYTSYLPRSSDVVVTSLLAIAANEVVELLFGGSIAVPAAYAYFGAEETRAIARGGAFNLGFVAVPLVLQRLPAGAALGLLWFALLFVAGVTSSVALMQPGVAFLQDELGLSRRAAVGAVGAGVFLAAHVPILGLRFGALDELDFWAGTVGLGVYALVETVAFAWAFGTDAAWAEICTGAQWRPPTLFKIVLRWVTPTYIAVVLLAWAVQQGPAVLAMPSASAQERAWRWGARALLAAAAALVAALVRASLRAPLRVPHVHAPLAASDPAYDGPPLVPTAAAAVLELAPLARSPDPARHSPVE